MRRMKNTGKPRPAKGPAKRRRLFHSAQRFPERAKDDWQGPLLDYKEVELLRKFLTSSNKLMSRKRAGTNAPEQRALKRAVKKARFLALLPYTSS